MWLHQTKCATFQTKFSSLSIFSCFATTRKTCNNTSCAKSSPSRRLPVFLIAQCKSFAEYSSVIFVYNLLFSIFSPPLFYALNHIVTGAIKSLQHEIKKILGDVFMNCCNNNKNDNTDKNNNAHKGYITRVVFIGILSN
jgi:hypothetical protein